MSTCRYSNSDLQQIILDDDLLLKLFSTFKLHNCKYYGGGLNEGDGHVFDEDGNSYILDFSLSKDVTKPCVISIQQAVRTMSVENYRLFVQILIQADLKNVYREQLEQLEEDNEKTKSNIWKKLWK